MGLSQSLELLSVALGLVYVVLAARPHVACWPFGIASSALGVGLMVGAQLYSEAMLYVAYVVLGVVGWVSWRGEADDRPIVAWSAARHGALLAVGSIVALALGGTLGALTDAAMPVPDAFTTVFSLIATWLVARKVLENWLYWVAVDAVSTWLYASRGLYVYAAQMALFTVVAAVGWWRWRGQLRGVSDLHEAA